MIIDDFHVIGTAVRPSETDAPLLVDADRVLALPISRQLLQPIAWRRAQVPHIGRRVQYDQQLLGTANEIDREPFFTLPSATARESLPLKERITTHLQNRITY